MDIGECEDVVKWEFEDVVKWGMYSLDTGTVVMCENVGSDCEDVVKWNVYVDVAAIDDKRGTLWVAEVVLKL